MATPAAVLSIIVEANTGKAEAALKEFQRNLSKADREKAEAELAFQVEKGGYNVFSGLVKKADAMSAKASLEFDVDQASLVKARAGQALLAKESSKLSDVFNRSQLSIGQWGIALAASIPVVFDLAGALGALTGSLGAATAGLGALGVGAVGVATVGLAGVASVAVPAIASLGDLKTAQDAYTEAVKRYGKGSSQAETALTKLTFEQQRAGPLATALAKNLSTLTQRWRELTKVGQSDFIGMLNDGVTRLNKKLPLLAESANRSMKALRGGFDAFLKRAAGPEFDHFIEVMTVTFAESVKPLAGAFGNIAKVLQRIAVAVAPDIVRMAKGFEDMTQGWADSTRNAGRLRETIHGLVNQANAWWKLIKATGELIVAVLVPGMGQGKRAVEGITETLKGWTDWVRSHPEEMKNFFKDGLETTKQLAQALLSFLPTLVELSKAMRPIARAFLVLVQGLNSLKVGSVSALTVLLGAVVATKLAKGIVGMTAAFGRLKAAALGAAAAEKVAMLAPGKKATAALPLAAEGGIAAQAAQGPAVLATPKGMNVASMAKYAKVAGGVAVAVTAVAGAFLALRDNFLGVRDVFTGFFEKVLKPLGNAFTDLIDELSGGHAAQVFGAIGDALGLVAKPMKWIAENLTKLLGLAALGAIFTGLSVAIGLVAAPIWLAIKGLTLLVRGIKAIGGVVKNTVGFIKDHWGKVGHVLGAPFRWMVRAARDAFGWVKDKAKDWWRGMKVIFSRLNFGEPFKRLINAAKDAFNWVKDKAGGVVGFVKNRWGDLKDVLTAPFRAVKSVARGVFNWIREKVEWALGKIQELKDKLPSVPGWVPGGGGGGILGTGIGNNPFNEGNKGGLVTAQGIVPQGFARGGMVGRGGRGPGLRDTIPAMLEVGELIVPKKIVEGTKKNAKLIAAVLIGELGKGHKEVGEDADKFAKDHGKTWEKVRDVAKKATQGFRKDTSDDFKKAHKNAVEATGKLKKGAGRDFEATAQDASRRTQKMRESVSDDFAKTRTKSLDSTQKMRKGVGSGYAGMATAAGEGMRRLAKMTNNALKALGVKKVDFHVAAEGKQRGGAIGGAGVGDKIPAMLEPGEFVINKEATKAARPMLEKLNRDVPRFQTGGMVDRTGVQHFAKGGMAAMIAEANKFERRGFPYTWGGGHSGFGIQPVDCSGAVSQVLHAAGLLKAPMVSGDLAHWGKPGKGPLTVYANPVHTFMSLAGKFFGTSASNPSGGAGWFPKPDSDYLSGFAARTMNVVGGMAEKVKRLLLKGPDGPLKDMGQASLDKTRRAANAYIDKKMPAGAFGGGQTLKDFSKGPGKIVGASVYGFGEPGTGTVGASGVSLPGKPAFAELDMGTALGHLPFGKKVGIEVGGKKAVGIKLDIGAGGGAVGGHHRAIDFWRDLAEKLGLSGSFLGLAKVRGLQKGGVVDRTGVKHQAIAAPFVGSFDKGGPVAQTGLGLLHKGEHVVAMKKGGLVAGGGGAGGGGPDAQGGGRRGVKAFGVERVRQMREKVGTLLGKAIPRMDETIGIAESLAGLTTSPGGSELSKGEVGEQMRLQQKLLATMRKTLNISKRAMGIVERTIKRIEDSIKQLERKIKREQKQMEQQVKKLTKFIAVERKKDKPDQKAIEKAQGKLRDVKAKGARPVERWQKDLTRRTEAMSALSRFRPAFAEATTEMSGLTGRGGRIFDTTLAIKELRAQGKPQAIGIEDLLAFAEAMRFGAFDRQLRTAGNIPTFAKGGVHRGGLALVGEKGPEVVQMPPAQVFPTGTAPAMAPPVVEITFADGMGWLKDFVSVEIKNREQRERGRWRRDNVAR